MTKPRISKTAVGLSVASLAVAASVGLPMMAQAEDASLSPEDLVGDFAERQTAEDHMPELVREALGADASTTRLLGKSAYGNHFTFRSNDGELCVASEVPETTAFAATCATPTHFYRHGLTVVAESTDKSGATQEFVTHLLPDGASLRATSPRGDEAEESNQATAEFPQLIVLDGEDASLTSGMTFVNSGGEDIRLPAIPDFS